ncbi:hypothetical protein D3C72_1548620 [compost metagenome]
MPARVTGCCWRRPAPAWISSNPSKPVAIASPNWCWPYECLAHHRSSAATLVVTGAPRRSLRSAAGGAGAGADVGGPGDSGVGLHSGGDRHQQRPLHVREASRPVPGDGARHLLVRAAGADGALAAIQQPHAVACHPDVGAGAAGGPQRQRFYPLAAARPLQPAACGIWQAGAVCLLGGLSGASPERGA